MGEGGGAPGESFIRPFCDAATAAGVVAAGGGVDVRDKEGCSKWWEGAGSRGVQERASAPFEAVAAPCPCPLLSKTVLQHVAGVYIPPPAPVW